MKTMLGVLPQLGHIPADNFAAEFPALAMVGINLDQSSAEALRNNIIPWDNGASGGVAWAGKLGRSIYAAGRQVLWSVPFPGARQLEAVVAGSHDALYLAIAKELVRAAPAGTTPIYVRPPWEFNISFNVENQFVDKDGVPNGELGFKAWRKIAKHFRDTSPRFRLAWSPAIERTQIVDPIKWWPGVDYVDVIAPDFYMGRALGQQPGQYASWYRPAAMRLIDFANSKQKPLALGEVGFETDEYIEDARSFFADTKTAIGGVRFVMWWEDFQMIDTRMLGGRSPKLAALYREMFG